MTQGYGPQDPNQPGYGQQPPQSQPPYGSQPQPYGAPQPGYGQPPAPALGVSPASVPLNRMTARNAGMAAIR